MYGYSVYIDPIDFDKMEIEALDVRMRYSLYDDYLDIENMLKSIFNISLVPYSSLSDIKKEYAFLCSETGFSGYSFDQYGYLDATIYYNDYLPYPVQRLTMAHEFKHILFEETEPSIKDEALADYFAKCLLAPKIIIIINNIDNVETIMKNFGVSYTCSYFHLQGINNRIKKYGKEPMGYEKDFLKLYKTNKT